MNYQEFLDEVKSYSEESYRDFHKRLLKNDSVNVLGVRVPQLRKLAKKYKKDIDLLMSYPDEYYEVTFIKLTAVSELEYTQFIKYVDECVELIDNWATCDCFVPKCIAKHKEEFLPYIRRYAGSDEEFVQRFALTTLLHFYIQRENIPEILKIIEKCDVEFYYVHMAAAWLVAEIVVKFYDEGIKILENGVLTDNKTHNKAIQKARESYRLSEEQKNYLKGLKN